MGKLIKEEIEEIKNLYLIGTKVKPLSDKFQVSAVAIRGLLKRRGITIRKDNLIANKKYDANEDYFDVVDDENKSYILGLLYADGYNNEERNTVTLSLAEKDKDILDKISNILAGGRGLRSVTSENSKHQTQYILCIRNKKLSQSLAKVGVVQNKTFKIMPPLFLDDNLVSHFLRGYFDGDGCIHISQSKYIRYYFCIVGTEALCNWIKNFICKKLNINCSIKKRFKDRDNNIRALEFNGRLQCKKMFDFLYSNCNLYMSRKYEVFKQVNVFNDKRYRIDKGVCSVCNIRIKKGRYCSKCYYRIYRKIKRKEFYDKYGK